LFQNPSSLPWTQLIPQNKWQRCNHSSQVKLQWKYSEKKGIKIFEILVLQFPILYSQIWLWFDINKATMPMSMLSSVFQKVTHKHMKKIFLSVRFKWDAQHPQHPSWGFIQDNDETCENVLKFKMLFGFLDAKEHKCNP
jgi:hypothetical protein